MRGHLSAILATALCASCSGPPAGTEGAPASSAEPAISDPFTIETDFWTKDERTLASVAFGFSDPAASDAKTLRIVLPGDPAKGAADAVGPSRGNQVKTRDPLTYGTYRFRAKAAACTPSLSAPEEVISGLFVYANGGDANGNGLTDNNEIDIEVACSDPAKLLLTVWTDYEEGSGENRHRTRVVDMRTGEYSSRGIGADDAGAKGMIAGLADPGFDATSAFHEMGFEWKPDRVRFFIATGGTDATLWEMADAASVPRPPAQFMLNTWHASSVWFVSEELFQSLGSWSIPAEYPRVDAALLVDWFSYHPYQAR